MSWLLGEYFETKSSVYFSGSTVYGLYRIKRDGVLLDLVYLDKTKIC